MRGLAAAAIIAAVACAPARGQEPIRPMMQPPPQIITSATGEVRVAPDRATIMIGVQTRRPTAADAATENSRKQRAVIDAIRAKGIAPAQISTTGFNVVPETQYSKDGEPRTSSYLVNNVVTVDVRRIDLVGPVIDAALTSGANQINSLTFGIGGADSVRRVALANAVAKARANAETMAQAAGGSLGTLLEMTSVESYSPPFPRAIATSLRADVAQDVSVPVEAGEELVRASVTARWQFIPSSPR